MKGMMDGRMRNWAGQKKTQEERKGKMGRERMREGRREVST